MATRKRAKTKKKSTKKSAKSSSKKKKALRAKAAPKKAKARAAARPATVTKPPAAPRPQAPLAMPGAPAAAMVIDGERVGVVTHYYSHLSVAIVLMERGNLRVGDRVHIKGHTSDFQQRVESMEIDHAHVTQVGPKQEFGVRVIEHAREHDAVYKLASPSDPGPGPRCK